MPRIDQVIIAAGTHAARPAAADVSEGSIYSCSDHSKVYRSDGAAWADWLTASASVVDDASAIIAGQVFGS